MNLLIKRIIAIIIDSILVAIISGVITSATDNVIGALAFAALTIGYQAVFLTLLDGRTPGKMLLGIRVVSSGGGKISPMQAVLRGVGYVINSYTCAIGWILAALGIFSIHDTLAGTKVIDS